MVNKLSYNFLSCFIFISSTLDQSSRKVLIIIAMYYKTLIAPNIRYLTSLNYYNPLFWTPIYGYKLFLTYVLQLNKWINIFIIYDGKKYNTL